MDLTSDEWFTYLATQLDTQVPLVRLRRDYAAGRVPLPEMGENLREAWTKYQRKARIDYGGLAVNSLLGRVVPNGVMVGSEDTTETAAAVRLWRDNRLDVTLRDAIRDMLITRRGYLWADNESRSEGALISRADPATSYADADPQRPWKARAFITAWRDPLLGVDKCWTYADSQATFRVRPSLSVDKSRPGLTSRVSDGGWVVIPDMSYTFSGSVPVAILERPVGFVEPHHDLLDQIIEGKLQRLVTTAMQAFRQRAIKGSLAKKDIDGNDIDWSVAFLMSPAAVWEIPEGLDIWESSQTDIRPLLDGEKNDARSFAAVTSTPVHVLSPESANQSAEGASTAKEGQVNNAKDTIARARPAIELAFVYALRSEGFVDIGGRDGSTVEVLFAPPEHVSLAERFDAATKGRSVGLSARTVKRTILGMSPKEIKQDEADLSSDLISQALAASASRRVNTNGQADTRPDPSTD